MIFFFYGADSYRSYQKVKQLRDKFAQEVDRAGLNIAILDSDNINLEKFNDAVNQQGFLSAKRLIIIKNIFSVTNLNTWQEEIINYLNKVEDNSTENYIIFWQEDEPEQSDFLFKKLQGFKYAQKFDLLTPEKLSIWVEQEVHQRQGQITKPAARLLVANIGNDLWRLSMEIDKLIGYKKEQSIIEVDVEQMIDGGLEDNIFQFTDALLNSNPAQAIKLLQDQLALGQNEQYLLSMILRQYRLLWQLKILLAQGLSVQQITAQTKIHPFVIKKLTPSLSKYQVEDLQKTYQRLIDLDYQLKSLPLNPELFFDLFIIKTRPSK